jgi:cytochrome c oxidase cbb3-type subunit 3
MPGWWKWLFIGTIVYSVIYCAFAVGGSRHVSPVASFELARAEEQRVQNSKKLSDDAASLMSYANDAKVKSAGAAIFAANCALCHKPDGSGPVGPNLTDDAYIHIKTIDDIPRFIRSGSANGAMPSFARMAPNDVVRAATYVASLRGKNLPGKAAEGVSISPWGSSAAAAPAAAAAGGPSSVITATPAK